WSTARKAGARRWMKPRAGATPTWSRANPTTHDEPIPEDRLEERDVAQPIQGSETASVLRAAVRIAIGRLRAGKIRRCGRCRQDGAVATGRGPEAGARGDADAPWRASADQAQGGAGWCRRQTVAEMVGRFRRTDPAWLRCGQAA